MAEALSGLPRAHGLQPWVYGILGLPLAFAALPLYLHLPRFYVEVTGLSLASLGSLLLLTRLLDALLDPLIGGLADRAPRKPWLVGALALFGCGFWALFHPPSTGAGPWLIACLVLTYLGFSASTIAYQAWGAELADSLPTQNRLTAAREAFGLVGVILAATLPAYLAQGLQEGVLRLVWVFIPLLMIASLVTLRGLPARGLQWRAREPEAGLACGQGEVILDVRLRRLLGVFLVNGLASAVPATLFLFYVADVLRAEADSGLLLGLYFVSAAASLPLWLRLAARFGRVKAWAFGMGISLAGFAGALLLQAGEVAAFAWVCLASGIGLGADLLFPGAMAADLGKTLSRPGSVFGLWNFVAKLNLALAAGLSLPLLAWWGYAPGQAVALGALSFTYAGLPLGLKLVALIGLWRSRHLLEKTS